MTEKQPKTIRLQTIAVVVVACFLLHGAMRAWASPQDGAAMQKTADSHKANAQQPEKKDEKIYHLGPDISPPRPLHIPADPIVDNAQLRNSKFQGVTVLELEVNTQGVPEHIHVARSAAKDAKKADRDKAKEMDAKAIDAVQQYRFFPAKRKGQPVPVWIMIEVKFHVYE